MIEKYEDTNNSLHRSKKKNKFSIQCFCSGQNFEFTSRANDWTTWWSNTAWLVTGIPLGSVKQESVKTKGPKQT